jgi:hypothetical protein
MPRPKHRRDKNHGKNGWVGGNPRYAGKGFKKGDRTKDKQAARKGIAENTPTKEKDDAVHE